MVTVQYSVEPHLTSDEFSVAFDSIDLSGASSVDRPEILDGMLRHADLIVTARDQSGLLVGVSRAITDSFRFATYLSDLAVDQAFQKQGIGKELISRTHRQRGSILD